MTKLYMYVVDRDFGFAPNPFHGRCTLATCKPVIRRVAREGDWIVGMGGARLAATGRCLFAMQVTLRIPFDAYWSEPEFLDKRPVRNGSRKMLVGDNIYHRNAGAWCQAESHHSYPDGSPNPHNIRNDTSTDTVLVSDHFFYFGRNAVALPQKLLDRLGYRNGIGHRVFALDDAKDILAFLSARFAPNILHGDPFDFADADASYAVETNRIAIRGKAR